MGFLGPLLGRTKLRKGNRENYFSIITAGVSFDGRTDIRFTEKAGLVFSPVESSYFDNLDSELRNLLKVSEKATDTCFEIMDDGYGTRWVLLDDPDFEDLAATLHLVGETVTEHGFGDRLIAAVFGFEYQEMPAYWVYNIKRGTFHPIVLSGEHERDNVAEMRLGALMEEEQVPVEGNLE